MWEIQGSNDGENFETIFRQDDPDASLWGAVRFQVIRFDAGEDFPLPTKTFNTLRFVTFSTGMPTGLKFQVGEIEFFGAIGGLTDTDEDGMPDAYEEENNLNPEVDDSQEDPDGDGIVNIDEFNQGTNPQSTDTDMDGLSDAVETGTRIWVSATNTGTSPTRADSDNDGLTDGVETNSGSFVDQDDTGTDPNVRDSDGDGANDGLEVSGGFDPNDPESVPSIQFRGGTFTIVHKDTSSTIDSRTTAEDLVSGTIEADQGEVTVQRPFINFVDDVVASFGDSIEVYPFWGPEGNGEGAPAPGLGGGPNHDDFGIEVTGPFFIEEPGGEVSIGINSDDGFVLWIDAVEVGTVGNRGRGDTIMTVDLTPGQHELRMIHWERDGGAGINLYISRGFGSFTSFNESDFELLHAFDIALAPLEGDDSDGDLMADRWETFYFGDLSHTGNEDGDGDGLDDLDEYQNKGNPTVVDTDGDGLEDGPEVATHGTDPASIDTDGDTLSDGEEFNDLGTNPALRDTDDDGFDDHIEIALGNDPLDAGDGPDAIIAVNRGAWNDPAVWSNGEAPNPANNYAVVGTVVPVVETPNFGSASFEGNRLSLLGPGATLSLAHSGIARVNELVGQAATIDVVRSSTGLGGSFTANGVTMINVTSRQLDLRSRLVGSGPITVTGSADGQTGSLLLNGVGNVYDGDWEIVGTSVIVNTPGSLGSGGVTLIAGRLVVNTPIFAPGSTLDIQGDGFGVQLNADIVYQDVRGVAADGSELFRLSELAAGVTEFTTQDLRDAFQIVDENIIGGDGRLIISSDGSVDSDGDGLRDSWEQDNFAGLSETGDGDADGDGLTNAREFRMRADPNSEDTDGDGLTDADEVETHGSNPLLADTDGDGVSDPDEVNMGGDPNDPGGTSGGGEATIELIGTGTGALLGNDLTDPEDDGNEAAGPDDPSWNWVSIESNNEPGFEGGEFSFNIFDNTLGPVNAKWCCDDPTPENPHQITVEFDAPVRLTHFTISSANDVPGRDPTRWQIQGSNDGLTFQPIFVQDDDVPIWTERLQVALITLAMPSPAYRFIRLEVSDTAEAEFQLGEVEYFGMIEGDGGDGFVFDPSFAIPDGTAYDVEYSRDLIDWEVIATDVTGVYTDTDPGRNAEPEGYYRGVTEP